MSWLSDPSMDGTRVKTDLNLNKCVLMTPLMVMETHAGPGVNDEIVELAQRRRTIAHTVRSTKQVNIAVPC